MFRVLIFKGAGSKLSKSTHILPGALMVADPSRPSTIRTVVRSVSARALVLLVLRYSGFRGLLVFISDVNRRWSLLRIENANELTRPLPLRY